MTLETLNHLFGLAAATNLRTFMTRLARGQNNPSHPVLSVRVQAKRPSHTPNNDETTAAIPSMHVAMPAPAGKFYENVHERWHQRVDGDTP